MARSINKNFGENKVSFLQTLIHFVMQDEGLTYMPSEGGTPNFNNIYRDPESVIILRAVSFLQKTVGKCFEECMRDLTERNVNISEAFKDFITRRAEDCFMVGFHSDKFLEFLAFVSWMAMNLYKHDILKEAPDIAVKEIMKLIEDNFTTSYWYEVRLEATVYVNKKN